VPDGFIAAFRRALLDTDADQALIAEVLTLPSESYLGDQMTVVDVDGIHRAREALAAAIGSGCCATTCSRSSRPTRAGRFDLTPAAMGRRALRNLLLGYLMRSAERPDPGALPGPVRRRSQHDRRHRRAALLRTPSRRSTATPVER
jgi:aminopeptidase N